MKTGTKSAAKASSKPATKTTAKSAAKPTKTAKPAKTVKSSKAAKIKAAVKSKFAKIKAAVKPKAAAKPKSVKFKPASHKFFDKMFLEEQVALLESEREKYELSAATLEYETQQLLETRKQGDVQFDEESSKGGSWAVLREQDLPISSEGDGSSVLRDQNLAISADAKATIEKIDEALGRIKNGSYGVCLRTGQPIPKARLKAIPWATETVEPKPQGLLLR